MLLFVGLGNPGGKYAKNRHNIGFMAVDEMVHRHNFSLPQKKFQSIVHEGRIGSQKILLIKPQTYMNESGRAVGEAMRFYKLAPQDVTVFYDELDLPLAKVKAKLGGGHAGHNGIRSTINHIGADFYRVRMGIDHPGHKSKVHGHVLGDFNREQQNMVDHLCTVMADCLLPLTKGDVAPFMSDLALKLNPPAKKQTINEKQLGQQSGPAGRGVRLQKQSVDGPMAEALKGLKDKS